MSETIWSIVEDRNIRVSGNGSDEFSIVGCDDILFSGDNLIKKFWQMQGTKIPLARS